MHHSLVAAMLLLIQAGTARPNDSQAEVAWARGIVKDFFQSALKQDASALGLLSPELARRHEKVSEFYPLYYCENFQIISEEVRPNGTEAIFRDNMIGGYWSSDFQGTFVLRMAKESGGRWSIRYIRLNRLD